ncbi:hypothetical protein LTQ02_14775 [Vibrio splendidus]|uniref:ATP-grasp fold amidoligase family protein n=1 Tax=Vibrio splendidus TaxID=29497 RepID=UPI001FB3B404|nr:ATP-grasp fold amidoligase family protein [Vibrio splendidus]UOE88715.1 hypothetical protein LTQ02_14775 [Vibrio splendidus]
MKKKIKFIIRDTLRIVFGIKGYTYLRFVLTHKYIPSLVKPRSFSEKIIYRKFNVDPKFLSNFVDKYTVRKFVKDTVGEDFLIPLIKVRSHIEPADFQDLPSSFVIKTSNGGGGENVMIVENKSELDLIEICKLFNSYLDIKIGNIVDEHFYDIEEPKILFEKLIKHKNGDYPSDYKIHMFNGENSKALIQVDSDRFGDHKRSIFDDNLQRLDFEIAPKYDPIAESYIFPENMDELISVARRLAKDFKYVRVDLYNVDGKIYFGELTFCHGSGWEVINPTKSDFLLGSYWEEF